MRTFSKILLGSLVLALGACGGGSSGGGGVAKIKGTWKSTTYLQTVNCGPTLGSVANMGPTTVIWGGGISADLIQTDPSTSCTINADVTGYTASALPGQTCLINDAADGATINITLTAYSFSLSADFQTATEAGSGSALVNFTADGTSATCTYTLQATYTKIGT